MNTIDRNTISCMIVDDEPNAVKLLENYIQKMPFLVLEQKCYDAFEAIANLKQGSVDLIFMDINMPQMSGLDLAAQLPKDQSIIFTTAYSSYALEGYEYNAVDYLLKPITFKRFIQSIDKFRNRYLTTDPAIAPRPKENVPGNCIFVKSGKQYVKLQYNEILYFEASKEYVIVVGANMQTLVYKRMKQLEAQLPPNFIRIHNSFIVNISNLDRVVDNHAVFGQVKLPISSSYRERFLNLIEKNTL
ncbi:LytTR family DNA-binding domain-containing protein [Sphingobacterium siyangense]|uniref:LytR/AlgR family response regulator transcription factor n=1 Tax=Sphingobacterium siyangense TaxID=459529 RepID=UPI00200DBA18|nr:LytTR family DNA-binding domain-containing protein [Sphingobacterium siyangense]UQA75385.1 LytTR family DNA-binding domain-containing protein [Sphingobacterium siyangense]